MVEAVPIEKLIRDPTAYLMYARNGVLARSTNNAGNTLVRRVHMAKPIWDEATILGPTVLDHQGLVLARGFNKILSPAMPGFPESQPDNWDIDAPVELTRLYDGLMGLVWWNMNKTPMVAAEDGLVSEATAWATYNYQANFRNAAWPEGFTPVVCILWRELRRPIQYSADELVLIGLVQISSGYSMPYEPMMHWGLRNKMKVAQKLPDDDKVLREEARGYVMTWPTEDVTPSIKVKVQFPEYDKARAYMGDMSQWEIWKGMKVDPLFYRTIAYDRTMPAPFRTWSMKCGKQMSLAADRVKTEAERLIAECPHQPLVSGAAFDWFTAANAALFPVIYATLKQNPKVAMEAIWKYLEPNMSKVPYLNPEF